MQLVTFAGPGSMAGDIRLGALVGERVVDLGGAFAAWRRTRSSRSGEEPKVADDLPIFPFTMLAFLQAGEPALAAAREALAFAAQPENLAALGRVGLAYTGEQVTFLPPILRPGKILCLGLNYRKHIEEMHGEIPEHPTFFAKLVNTLVGHRAPIVLPTVSQEFDFEGELAVVIGRRGKSIPRERALDYVAGYSCFNDVTARDYQRRTSQWLQGKTFDSSGPFGPAIVTRDEIADEDAHPLALDITTRLNGQVMQHSNTGDFIFDIPTTIAYVSQFLTLEPGDVISTGTPSGVGAARTPPVFLKPGDLVEVEIAGVGTLASPVVAPQGELGETRI